MILLATKNNVTAPGGAYPYGNIKDDTGVGDGTPVDVLTYGDIHQTMERLFALSGITANGLPDNLTNGFQLYEALTHTIADGLPGHASGAWIDAGTGTTAGVIPGIGGTGTVTFDPTFITTNKYKLIGRTLYWQFQAYNFTISGSGVNNFALGMPGALNGVYKFSNIGMTSPGRYNLTNNLSVGQGTLATGFDEFLFVSLVTSANFTAGTGNQSISFCLVAEIEPI